MTKPSLLKNESILNRAYFWLHQAAFNECVRYHHTYGVFVDRITWRIDRESSRLNIEAHLVDREGCIAECKTLSVGAEREIEHLESETGLKVTTIWTEYVTDAINGMPILKTSFDYDYM
mgnify:CR=1 FL=1